MSTTNIDEQKMQQINSSDTITQFMEKCNNNFSNIFRYRSGPEGKQGVEGSQGVPTKPKVPIHVWRKGVEYYNETSSGDGYIINDCKVDLTDIKYQEGHLIMLKNGHVYILEEYENSTLKPNYIMALQSYNQDDVIDGRTSYIHIAYTNSTDDYYDFITNEELQKQENVGNGEIKYKYMGLYSNYEEESSPFPETYTWVRIVGDTGEKGDKGDKGDTPTSTSVEVVGYSLDDLSLDSEYWESSISDLGELKPGTPIYIKNKYTWDDGTVTYGKTVTMAGTQGIKGETGRVLFYLGSFKDGTLTGQTVKGRLNQYRCDYYIDINDIAWMRTGTPDDETSLEGREGSIFGNSNGDYKNYWTQSDKVGFLQANAISADMINVETLAANEAFITDLVANNAFIGKIVADEAFIKEIQATEISANKITTGRISSTNNESYFDLDNGTFALGNALTYDGSGLSIKGVPNEDRIEEILTGLVGDIDIEIGGRNLLKNSKFTNLADGKTYDENTYWIYCPDSTYIDQYTLTVEDGHLKLTSTFASWGENWDKKSPRMGFYQTKTNKNGGNYVLSFDAYADKDVWIKAETGHGDWEDSLKRKITTTKQRFNINIIGANGDDPNYNIFFLRLDKLDKDIQTSIYFDNFKLEEGTVATDWTPAPEDVDDAIAAVDSKAQSLEYLKEALTYETDIAGGIVATTSIQLRDKVGSDYVVNAGISGIEDDNVLLWGGGTYEEAVAASKSVNYYKNGTTPITSLLKKDGQGKIGIFKIGEEKVEINVPNNGLISIDASNSGESGICISKGSDIRTIISDLSIDDVETKRRSVKSYINIDYTHKDVTPDEDFGNFMTFEPYYVNGVPIALELTSVKMTLYGYSSIPVDPDAVYTIKGYIVIDTLQSNFWDDNCVFEATFNGKDIKDNKYVYELSIPKSSRNDIVGNLDTIRVDYGVSSNSDNSLIFDKSDLEVKGTIWLGSSLELARESIIIGNDGISCMSGQSRFLVKNTNGGQIILVDGLPTKKDNLKKGQLWNNNGVLSIF